MSDPMFFVLCCFRFIVLVIADFEVRKENLAIHSETGDQSIRSIREW